ncbi:hypothetical protein, partial [Nocardia nova]|uniref:hypothetical protein n=1 Tax=Nocardia nova TaxID=37330 RepID=UPI001E348F1D
FRSAIAESDGHPLPAPSGAPRSPAVHPRHDLLRWQFGPTRSRAVCPARTTEIGHLRVLRGASLA